jgi:aminoglycoside 2'-N-acetyltransferase I
MGIRAVPYSELSAGEAAQLRALCDAAWAGKGSVFLDEFWQSSVEGTHIVLDVGGEVVSHASVLERVFDVGGRQLSTGYVEAVATLPSHQLRGHGSALMEAVAGYVGERYELGALDTENMGFYERLGWQVWQGPLAVETGRGVISSPEEQGYVMVLLTRRSPADLDLTAHLTCHLRNG